MCWKGANSRIFFKKFDLIFQKIINIYIEKPRYYYFMY